MLLDEFGLPFKTEQSLLSAACEAIVLDAFAEKVVEGFMAPTKDLFALGLYGADGERLPGRPITVSSTPFRVPFRTS